MRSQLGFAKVAASGTDLEQDASEPWKGGNDMESLAEFTFAPANFCRLDILRRRYEVLLRDSHCLATARPEDLCLATQLRHVVDFDVFDSIVNREADPAFVGAGRPAYIWQSQDSSREEYLDEVGAITDSWKFVKLIEFYKRQDWKPKREEVPAGQHGKVIMFPTTNKKSA